jgi:membrane-bound metal-dependent hydrolase YbcI (DUF457 family)
MFFPYGNELSVLYNHAPVVLTNGNAAPVPVLHHYTFKHSLPANYTETAVFFFVFTQFYSLTFRKKALKVFWALMHRIKRMQKAFLYYLFF